MDSLKTVVLQTSFSDKKKDLNPFHLGAQTQKRTEGLHPFKLDWTKHTRSPDT